MWKLFTQYSFKQNAWSTMHSLQLTNHIPSFFSQVNYFPFNSKNLSINSPYCLQFLWCQLREHGIRSTNDPLFYFVLYSHRLAAWYCMDVVRQNLILVTRWNYRLNNLLNLTKLKVHHLLLWFTNEMTNFGAMLCIMKGSRSNCHIWSTQTTQLLLGILLLNSHSTLFTEFILCPFYF